MVYLGGLIFHARPFKSFQEGMFRYCVGWDGSAYILAFLTFNKGSIVFLMSLYLEQARTQVAGVHASPYVCGPTNKFKMENRFIWCLFVHTVTISF